MFGNLGPGLTKHSDGGGGEEKAEEERGRSCHGMHASQCEMRKHTGSRRNSLLLISDSDLW